MSYSYKIKEDLAKTKDAKEVARSQQLRELSWKVTDMIALGSSAVKEFETKSAYQMQRELKNNLSLTEAELLCDMCEENISDEDSFLMNVEEI